MKILHLIDIPWWSGLSAYAFDCINAHKMSGHEVMLACQKGSLPHRKGLEMEIEILPIRGRESRNALVNFLKIFRAQFQKNPDCIVAHTGSTHWIGAVCAAFRNVPLIRTRAISQPVRSGALNKKIYSGTQWIITASEKLRRECLQRLSTDLSEKVRTIYPPVENPSLLSPEPHNGDFPPYKRVGILARLDPKKGYWDFIKAAKAAQKKIPEAEFHIAGSEENLPWRQILKRCKELALKNVVYHGFLTHGKIWGFLKNCTIGVIASTGSEEVSRALLEWMSAGRPVVSTSVGCIPEILRDGEDGGGFLISPNDPEQMAEKIVILLNRPDLTKKMGAYNFDLCRKKYSVINFRAEWHKVLYDH